MADINIKFNLKQPKADKPTPIRLSISWHGNRLITNTGESIPPKYWNTSQQVRATKDYPQGSKINKRLNEIKAKVSEIYHELKTAGEDVGKYEIKEQIDIFLNRATTSDVPTDFLSFVEYYIESKRGTINPQTKRLRSERTFSKYNRVKSLCLEINKYIDFRHFNESFYTDYYERLMHKKGFSLNTIGKYTRTLKTLLGAAAKPKFGVNKYNFYLEYPVLEVESRNIALNKSEIDAMYKLDLTDKPYLDRVRDMFVIGCKTGLRFSDIYAIQKHHIEGDLICLRTYKGTVKVTIPILKETRAILAKYDCQLPDSISNQKFNDYVKEVGKLAGLDTIERTSIDRATGEDVEFKPKYKLISTHTARRSFCTNMYNDDIPVLAICAMTGHKTETEFLKYLKVDKSDHALRVLKMITEIESNKSMYANG
jgi:integrase